MIIVQKRRNPGGYAVPSGGEVLWYGLAADLPSPWTIDAGLSGLFVMGADTATDVPAGSFTHDHTNPASTGEVENHTHPIRGVVNNTGSGSTVFYPSGDGGTAAPAHGHSDGNGSSSANGGHAHSLSKTKPATVYPPYRRLYWIVAGKEAVLPIGGIVMWDEAIALVADGFHICAGGTFDGIDTPDLRDAFVWAASEDGHVNATGGSETHDHENDPTDEAGGHSHAMNVNVGGTGSTANASGYVGTAISAGGHPHGLAATANGDPDHDHLIGNTEPGSSLPPYLALYYIMRTV